MSRAFLLRQLALLLAGFVVINLLTAVVARRFVPRVLIRAIDASPAVTDLFLGNSLVAAGLDVPAYERAAAPGSRGLNAALGASDPVEHALLLRRALRTRPRRVYYGFLDQQLTVSSNAAFGALIGNRAVVHYLDRETAIGFLCPHDPLAAWRIRLVSWLPVVVERVSLWSKVELLRRRLGGIGLPAQATNAFGRAGDFALLEASDPSRFARECRAQAERRTGFSAPVADLVASAKTVGATLCFVEMPMTAAHRLRYYSTPEWRAYAAALGQQATRDNARFIDASDWIADDGFADPLHLNSRGAATFSQRLAVAP